MSLDRRSLLAGLGLCTGVTIIGVAVLFPESDEERIVALLDELAVLTSFSEPIASPVFYGSRLSEFFKEHCTPKVQIDAEEARETGPVRREELGVFVASTLARRFDSLTVTFHGLQVDVDGSIAKVKGRVSALSRQSTGPSRGERPVRFVFERSEGTWLMEAAWLGRPSP